MSKHARSFESLESSGVGVLDDGVKAAAYGVAGLILAGVLDELLRAPSVIRKREREAAIKAGVAEYYIESGGTNMKFRYLAQTKSDKME